MQMLEVCKHRQTFCQTEIRQKLYTPQHTLYAIGMIMILSTDSTLLFVYPARFFFILALISTISMSPQNFENAIYKQVR